MRCRTLLQLSLITSTFACGDDNGAGPGEAPTPGLGVSRREYNAEVWVRGSYAYTSSWGVRDGSPGNIIRTWDVTGETPVLVDRDTIAGVSTTGDVQTSDDGRWLVVATEPGTAGSIVIFDLANPANPVFRARHQSANTRTGVHTAEVARVGGRLYAFLAVNPTPPKLVIVDITDPGNMTEVLVRQMGLPAVHDVFVRDGILFTALWDAGMTIWDIGGGGLGGTVADPVAISSIATVGGNAHNIAWFHDPTNGSRKYVFVGEEGPATLFSSSSGDIHVVDVTDPAAPAEVAFFHVPGAGTHNFSLDEPRGVLYAAFYNAGVRALDIRGDLSACTPAQRAGDGRCDLGSMGRVLREELTTVGPVFVWGVHYAGNTLFASDMLNGLWKLDAVIR